MARAEALSLLTPVTLPPVHQAILGRSASPPVSQLPTCFPRLPALRRSLQGLRRPGPGMLWLIHQPLPPPPGSLPEQPQSLLPHQNLQCQVATCCLVAASSLLCAPQRENSEFVRLPSLPRPHPPPVHLSLLLPDTGLVSGFSDSIACAQARMPPNKSRPLSEVLSRSQKWE